MKKKVVCALLTAGLGLAMEFNPDIAVNTTESVDITESVDETEIATENEETESIDQMEAVEEIETVDAMETVYKTEIIEEMEIIEELAILPEEIETQEWEAPEETEPCTVYFDNGNVEIISAENPEQYLDWANRVENRNGKLVIDVIYGTVLDANGNGEDVTGHYIKYDPERFEVGDMVETYLIYSPDNNALDGMEMRIDYLMEGEGK